MPAFVDANSPVSEPEVREEVRRFYDSVGWRRVGPGLFQNARYEDLRPVSQEYIQRCHRRVLRHLRPSGKYLLDAGSGPIQYPEYLEYSAGYTRRLCLDLSALALREARERIGSHGLFVVGDIAHLPLRSGVVDGAVSLHTFHHLPAVEQQRAFGEMIRVLVPGALAVVVYGWGKSAPIETWTGLPTRWASSLLLAYARWRGRGGEAVRTDNAVERSDARGTHTFKHGYQWLKDNTRDLPELDILVWRTVSTNFLRAFVHDFLLGRAWLRLLYWLEERAPHGFGRFGQYPLIVLRKPPAANEPSRKG
jgi:ubiquinone/menaquinone biosynthesis C-methylase UbiE